MLKKVKKTSNYNKLAVEAKDKQINKAAKGKFKMYLYIIFSFGLLIRLYFAINTKGHPIDMGDFKYWSLLAANNFTHFYSSKAFTDYPPLYIYILFIIGKITIILKLGSNIIAFNLLIKLPSILADLVTAYMLIKLSNKYLTQKWGVVIASIYILNPVIIFNSSIWGQIDSFFAMFIILAILLLKDEKIIIASMVFTAAVLLKPQGIIFLPILLFEFIKNKKINTFLSSIIFSLVTFILIILPFSFNQDLLWIFKLYIKTISEYPYASLNAFNLFSLLGGNWKDASQLITLFGIQTILTYKIIGYVFIVLITSFVAFLYLKGKTIALPGICALILITGVFVLSTGMHERYMYPATALVLLVFILIYDKRFLMLYGAISITGFFNTYLVYNLSQKNIFQVPQNDFVLLTMSLFNVFILIYMVIISIDVSLSCKV
jgi:Gpi18-like mannosyltransferase